MAGLTGRMSTVVKAKVSKLLDRAEDPAETLDYSYQKQVEQLQNVKKGIADVVTAKKRLQMQESLAAAERRQARHAGPPGAGRRPGGPRARRRWNARTSPRPSCRGSTRRSRNSKSSSRS